MDVDILFDDISRSERTKMSLSQFGLMVDFLSLNPELICCKKTEACAKEISEKKWEELAAVLNSDGTGAQKSVDRWKKSWKDMKWSLRKKIDRRNSPQLIPGCQRQYVGGLSELEEKAWNLIKTDYGFSKKKMNMKTSIASINKNVDVTASYLPQELQEPRYIVVNVDGIPLNVSAAQVESTNNVLFGLETSSARMECISSNSEQSEIENGVPEVTDNAAKTSETVRDSRIKSEPVHSSAQASVVSKEAHSDHGSILGNQSDVHEQNSIDTAVKRLKMRNFSNLRRRRKDNGLYQLLKRQNELLEYIAASIAKIEKSVETSSSQDTQRKSAIGNIVENIDKIAGSLGSVSKSLKKISEK